MAEGFAGARSLDERRRRRLAGENGVSVSAHLPKFRNAAFAVLPPGPVAGPASFPIERLISARKWKLFVFTTGLVVVMSGLAWFGMSDPIRSDSLGEGVSKTFRLPNGSAFTYFSMLLLIGTAQLSFTIGWVRSRNQHDFGGKYRIWRWAAVMFFASSVCVATGLHLALADVVAHSVKSNYPYHRILNWLAPICFVSSPIVMKIIQDMSNCRLSTALFSTTVVAAFILAVAPAVARWDVELSTLVIARMAVCCLLFCSLLIHAWYVVHISSEPPGQSTIRSHRQDPDDRPSEIDSSDIIESSALERSAALVPKAEPAQNTPTDDSTGRIDESEPTERVVKASKGRRRIKSKKKRTRSR